MKRILTIIAGIIIVVALPLTVFLVRQNQEVRSKAAPATTLSFSPTTKTVKVGDAFTLDVVIDTGGNQVYIAELYISYDPSKLEATNITYGPLFPNVPISGKVDQSGRASITLASENPQTPAVGTGVMAKIGFTAVAVTSAPVIVKIDQPDTFLGAKQEGASNVLVGAEPARITVTSVSGSNQLAGAGLTPTPTTQPAILSPTPTIQTQSATNSALLITVPSGTTPLTTTQPLIKGSAPKNSTVTLTIHPGNLTVSLSASTSGIWSYTPSQPLNPGPHEITVTAQDPLTGTVLTATRSFVIASSTGAGTQDGTPVSGNITPTVLLLIAGLTLLIAGFSVPIQKIR